jgi:type IV pilus assembly protein PilV
MKKQECVSGISGWSDKRGFSLIEAMIAMVILAVGLLALSGMQSISMARNVDADELTRVSNLASDIIERMQFNRKNVAAYNGISVQAASQTCPTVTTNLMASGDCAQWRSLLAASKLPGFVGTISVNPSSTAAGFDPLDLNRRTVTVQISWTGSVNNQGVQSMSRSKSVRMATVIAPE